MYMVGRKMSEIVTLSEAKNDKKVFCYPLIY